MELIANSIPKSVLKVVWGVQTSIYWIWFIYIYGILGHVCPVTFLGLWNASLIGVLAFSNRRPSFIGAFLSLLVAAIGWGISFFFLHPQELVRNITLGPFIVVFLTPFFLIGQQYLFGNKRISTLIELRLENYLGIILTILQSVIVISFFTVPWIRENTWNDSPTEWFDTIFGIGDVWRLFLVIALIGLVSLFFMVISIVFTKKKYKFEWAYGFRLLGYTLFGMLAVGTWCTFVFLGKPNKEENNRN